MREWCNLVSNILRDWAQNAWESWQSCRPASQSLQPRGCIKGQHSHTLTLGHPSSCLIVSYNMQEKGGSPLTRRGDGGDLCKVKTVTIFSGLYSIFPIKTKQSQKINYIGNIRQFFISNTITKESFSFLTFALSRVKLIININYQKLISNRYLKIDFMIQWNIRYMKKFRVAICNLDNRKKQ